MSLCFSEPPFSEPPAPEEELDIVTNRQGAFFLLLSPPEGGWI